MQHPLKKGYKLANFLYCPLMTGTFVCTAQCILLWERVQVMPLIFLHLHFDHTIWKTTPRWSTLHIHQGGRCSGACSCVCSLSMKECSSLLATSTGCKTPDGWFMLFAHGCKVFVLTILKLFTLNIRQRCSGACSCAHSLSIKKCSSLLATSTDM